MLRLAVVFVALAPLAQAQQPPQTFTPPPQAPGYSLALDDEFTAPDLSPNGFGQFSPETSVEMLSADKLQYKTVAGAWPAFLMIPIQDATGQDYYHGVEETGELDIFEGQGLQTHTFIGTQRRE